MKMGIDSILSYVDAQQLIMPLLFRYRDELWFRAEVYAIDSFGMS